jgi:AmiR/NasT family two-component response regulator
MLKRSECAWLLARLETMPVIEQAKGIIMAQSRCGQASGSSERAAGKLARSGMT